MAITVQCPRCAKQYRLADQFAGKRVKCTSCQAVVVIPEPQSPEKPEEILDAVAVESEPDTREAEPQPKKKKKKKVKPSESRSRLPLVAIAAVALLLLAVIGNIVKLFEKATAPGTPILADKSRPSNLQIGAPVPSPFQPGAGPSRNAMDQPAPQPGRMGSMPAPLTSGAFPPLGSARTLQPGIVFHEIRLAGAEPGKLGKLWLYLPEGKHADKSLPCILIAPAGSPLVVGMDLGEDDRAEHLPYVRAGFAVLAYELDGPLSKPGNPTNQDFLRATKAFQATQGGIINARTAFDYVQARVPQVDPLRIIAAGHSSAGTVALLFAEHEPSLKACVAYAPACDITKHQAGALARMEALSPGLRDFAVRASPITHVDRLKSPVFLFHALDDNVVPASGSQAFAKRCPSAKLVTVPRGGHFDSMISQGIPQAIQWLKGLP